MRGPDVFVQHLVLERQPNIVSGLEDGLLFFLSSSISVLSVNKKKAPRSWLSCQQCEGIDEKSVELSFFLLALSMSS
jgi:hypothetical protein